MNLSPQEKQTVKQRRAPDTPAPVVAHGSRFIHQDNLNKLNGRRMGYGDLTQD